MKYLSYCFFILTIFGCQQRPSCPKTIFDRSIIDSVKQKADSTYQRKFSTEEFVSADYFINKKDSTVCQVWKDTAGMVRQVIMTRIGTRFYTAEYFSNGQLKAKLPFDQNGKFDGEAKFYFENGCVLRSGSFVHGNFHGQWNRYDENGNLVSVDEYDDRGGLINTSKR